jgi:hypothetical protein
MSLSEGTFRRLLAILALICALASLIPGGAPFLIIAVVLLAVVLLL